MSENTVHDEANRLLASPRKSLRVLLQETGLSRSTCQGAAKESGLHAYRFRVVQELKQQDYDKRMTYCCWFQTFIDENPGILDYVWFSDDTWFHLSGYVNSQNTRLWGSENPHALFEETLHSQKVGVFCALSQRRIIGPMFFDTTVTSQMYIELFREFVNQLDDQELTLSYYQQYGDTSHTSGVSMAKVESFFPDRVITQGLGPPRSPDLTPRDFFLWGHLKGRAYMNKPRTLDELRENIRRELLLFDT
jgi:hypothetical protein